MSQVGYTPISLYYSSTAGNTPTAGNLVAGELAINTADGKLFYKDSAGVVQVIAGKGGAGVAGGSNTQVQYNSSGSLAGSANFTFNGTTVTIANDASISGLTVGKGGGSQSGNTVLGNVALVSNTVGNGLTAIGYAALNANTQYWNTAVGYSTAGVNTTGTVTAFGAYALGSNTTGVSNVAVGGYTGTGATEQGALYSNTTGGYNTAIGIAALKSNTTASNNTAVGYQAAYSTTSSINTAIGYQALYTNSSGNGVVVGHQAGYANTTGDVTAMGYRALYSNTTGVYSTAIGNQALYSNTTASYNTAVGYQAGYANQTGSYNVFIGRQTGLAYNSSNGGNTIVGDQAGGSLTTGYGNTFVGGNSPSATQACGYYITTGNNNTILGGYCGNQGGLDIRTASNYIVLSDGAGNPYCRLNGASGNKYWVFGTGGTSTADYAGGAIILNGTSGSGIQPIFVAQGNGTTFWQIATQGNLAGSAATNIVIQNGNSGGVYLNGAGATSWSAYSDSRLKDITGTYTNALADIAQIEPVKFTWKDDENKRPCVGVIAQSVLPVVPEAVGQTKRSKDDETEYYSVSYTDLIPLLIASVQELKAEVDSLKQQLGK